jgi:hypothetical protein
MSATCFARVLCSLLLCAGATDREPSLPPERKRNNLVADLLVVSSILEPDSEFSFTRATDGPRPAHHSRGNPDRRQRPGAGHRVRGLGR